MRFLILIFFSLICFTTKAQIRGTVTDAKNKPVPFVNILVENTFQGTTTNGNGIFELNVTKAKTYTLIVSCLGFKTEKIVIDVLSFPHTINIQLTPSSVELNEVLINNKENPAIPIMRKAIANRKKNFEKIKSFKADFYSRGLIKIKDAPEKFFGQDVGDLGGGLDSTRSGVIYLSETISKIQYLKPNKLRETISASKVSGDDNGFSFNNARDVNFNFYNNTVEFGNLIVSPIADNAFSYYKYKLNGVFYDERGNLINKIEVIPKRINDPIFSGFIYIVEDQWTIYALELDIKGTQARLPAVDIISLKQNFSYSQSQDIWALISQSIDFKYKFLGFNGDGRFTAVYSNYLFNLDLEPKIFGPALVSFTDKANQKDSTYWNTIRPVPLTQEERTDYIRKDSIQKVKESKTYLDSVDRVKNKFKWKSILNYTFQNSFKDFTLGHKINVPAQFNTVQGYTLEASVFFRKNYDEFRRYFRSALNFEYGFSDKRLRATANLTYKFNNINRARLNLMGGTEVKQFNNTNPIKPIENTISSLFFEDNYLKIYERYFAELSYSQELFNGFNISSQISFERRQALFNTTDQVFINEDNDFYTANNPIDQLAFGSAPFNNHNIFKLNLWARISFKQNYLSYPKSKFNVNNPRFPDLFIGYEKGFAGTNSNYNFDQIKLLLYHAFNIDEKGLFTYNLKAGKFFNADNIAFMDYQHFNGNQTHVSQRGNYTNVFNNLEYYRLSTNDAYFEAHAEHDFNGFILGKIPLLNKLNFNIIMGAHFLSTPQFSPYHEYTLGIDNIGWGKWRFLRIDYIRSYQNGFINDAVVFGLKFF